MTLLNLDYAEYRAAKFNITPEQAQYWLDNHNTANRKLREPHAANIARQMDLGYWNGDTHEGIAFAKDGSLIDGQHRLRAVVLHGRPVEMLVWTGQEPDNRLVVGAGTPRTAADTLQIAGYQVTRHVPATLNRLITGGVEVKRGEKLSTKELEAAYLQHREAVEFAHTALPKTPNVHLSAALRAAVARAYYHVSADLLSQFCEAYLKCRPIGERNCTAAIMLRSYTTKNRGLNSKKAQAKLYKMTQNMIHRFQNGEDVGLVRPAGSEMFPLPERTVMSSPAGPVIMRRRNGVTSRVASGTVELR